MVRVALGQVAPEQRRALDLVGEERVDPEDEEGRGREEVGAVEGAVEVFLAVLADLLGVLGLLSAVEAPRVDGSHQQSLEAHRNHHQPVGLHLRTALVVRVLLHLAVQDGHLPLVLQQEGQDQRHLGRVGC